MSRAARTTPDGAAQVSAARPRPTRHVDLRPSSFRCLKPSGEWTKDEIYWSLSAGVGTYDQLTRKQVTDEFGSIVEGSWPSFPLPGYDMRQEVLFWIQIVADAIANFLDISTCQSKLVFSGLVEGDGGYVWVFGFYLMSLID
ncbi:hypothetical protein PG988_011758 [Apiospora saccharicola]